VERKLLKPRVTVPKKKLQISSAEEIFAVLLGPPLLGLMLLLIPIIGWIAGSVILFGSFGGLILALRALGIKWGLIKPKINDYKLVGICPYCDNDLSVNLPSEKTTCGFCKERVLVKREKFYTIIRRHYEES
jgi:hypothetical protein